MPEPAPAKPSNLIGPDELNLDATVPQCLDDQYVSDSVMERMLKKKADYLDPEISALRENEIRTEFLSLTSSSQLVIRRRLGRHTSLSVRVPQRLKPDVSVVLPQA
jgi:hypothetical protein